LKSVRSLGAVLVTAISLVLVMGVSSVMAQDMPAVNITDGQTIDAYGFDPPSLTANVGDTVMWTNTGTMAHTVTASDGSFDSGSINPGEMFSLTVTSAGTFAYTCTPHPWMKATLTVGDG
jgi:plastocyanin